MIPYCQREEPLPISPSKKAASEPLRRFAHENCAGRTIKFVKSSDQCGTFDAEPLGSAVLAGLPRQTCKCIPAAAKRPVRKFPHRFCILSANSSTLLAGGEKAMQEERKKSDMAQRYATNLLIVKENCNPVTGIQYPETSAIADAKERVDANEK